MPYKRLLAGVNISHQIKNREISTKSIFSRLPVAEFRESNHQIAIFGAQKTRSAAAASSNLRQGFYVLIL
jgi:hypothetical protein